MNNGNFFCKPRFSMILWTSGKVPEPRSQRSYHSMMILCTMTTNNFKVAAPFISHGYPCSENMLDMLNISHEVSATKPFDQETSRQVDGPWSFCPPSSASMSSQLRVLSSAKACACCRSAVLGDWYQVTFWLQVFNFKRNCFLYYRKNSHPNFSLMAKHIQTI